MLRRAHRARGLVQVSALQAGAARLDSAAIGGNARSSSSAGSCCPNPSARSPPSGAYAEQPGIQGRMAEHLANAHLSRRFYLTTSVSLANAMTTTRVQVYSTPWCPYCVRAKALLRRLHVDYDEIDVSDDPEKRAWLVGATGQRTVPQIFIDGRSIGGFTELDQLERRGQLQHLLATPAAN
jgi:glutaredoxin 3